MKINPQFRKRVNYIRNVLKKKACFDLKPPTYRSYPFKQSNRKYAISSFKVKKSKTIDDEIEALLVVTRIIDEKRLNVILTTDKEHCIFHTRSNDEMQAFYDYMRDYFDPSFNRDEFINKYMK